MSEVVTGINPESQPAVSCSIGLGRLVTSIEVDADYFARFMRQNGVSEDEIGKTCIVINDETLEHRGKYVGLDDETVTYGDYHPLTKTAHVHIGSLKSSLDHYSQVAWEGQMSPDLYNDLGTTFASKHIMHELGHRVVHASGDGWFKEELEYFRDIVPEKLRNRIVRYLVRRFSSPSAHKVADLNRDLEVMKGMNKRGRFEHYENSPSERMAEDFSKQAEDAWPEGYQPIIVSFRMS